MTDGKHAGRIVSGDGFFYPTGKHKRNVLSLDQYNEELLEAGPQEQFAEGDLRTICWVLANGWEDAPLH